MIGSLFAGHLARVADVSVLCRRPEHARALNDEGLRVSGRHDFRVDLRAATDPDELPEPAPRPGPGCVLAPMCQRRSTGVRWPGLAANGRQRKFWSRESEPEYGSP